MFKSFFWQKVVEIDVFPCIGAELTSLNLQPIDPILHILIYMFDGTMASSFLEAKTSEEVRCCVQFGEECQVG